MYRALPRRDPTSALHAPIHAIQPKLEEIDTCACFFLLLCIIHLFSIGFHFNDEHLRDRDGKNQMSGRAEKGRTFNAKASEGGEGRQVTPPLDKINRCHHCQGSYSGCECVQANDTLYNIIQ